MLQMEERCNPLGSEAEVAARQPSKSQGAHGVVSRLSQERGTEDWDKSLFMAALTRLVRSIQS